MRSLSPIQKKIYEYIKKAVSEKGYSPSVRDIANDLSIKSTSTVYLHLKRLEEAGYIYKEDGKSRAIRIEGEAGALKNRIPILGYVRAGSPVNAEENFDGYVDFAVPHGYDRENLFALRVRGQSMTDAGILDGDTVIVNKTDYAENGDTVVALIDGETTVKTFFRENGRFRLQPQNKTMEPILLSEVQLIGRVIASLRFY